MTDESGGFYSAQDADSEGEEGKFFVWRPEAVVEVLGKEDGEVFNRYFDVTIDGNFEGMSILNVKSPAAKFAAAEGMSEDELSTLLAPDPREAAGGPRGAGATPGWTTRCSRRGTG